MRLSTRLTAAMVLLVVMTAVAVGVLSYRSIEQTVLPSELTRLDARARLQTTSLDTQVSAARADVLAMSLSPAMNGIMRANAARGRDPIDGTRESAWRERLAQLFQAQLSAKPEYSEFRLIGIANNGREVIRVDRSGPGNTARIVPEDGLLPKADRNYFKDTIALKTGQVHVTPITLNEINAPETQGPRIPFLRVSTPAFFPDGRLYGFVIINIDMRPALDAVLNSASLNGHAYVVNEAGDYLANPDASRTFGFNLGQRYRLQDEFPQLAAGLATGTPFQGAVKNARGQSFATAMVPVRLAGGPRVTVVEAVPMESALASAGAAQRATILGGCIAALVAALIGVWFARSLVRPLKEMSDSLSNFTGEESVKVPESAAGEIGTLARAYVRMAETIREKTSALQREIAERTKIEERERLYVAAVQSAADAITTSTMEGTLTTWNAGAERLFGYKADEAVGRPMTLIAAPDRREEQIENLKRLRNGERIVDCETVRRAKDGTLCDVSVTLSPIADANGKLVNVSAIYRDIGPRKQQERLLTERADELQRSNAELEQFAYVASHDLQEPLRMVASYAELLAERYQGKLDAKADKYIGYAVDGAKRMQRLVNDLLTFSRAGRHEAKAQPIELNKLVGDVVKSLDRVVTAASAKVETALLPVIVADPVQMTQVFQNLIGNAVKFRGERAPVVTIAAEPHGSGWKFSVADNGIGIEPQYSDRIFQMFQRLHDRASYEGNGIGLPIAKKIVERHGGRIWFESVPGQGTVFHFTLPAKAEEKAA